MSQFVEVARQGPAHGIRILDSTNDEAERSLQQLSAPLSPGLTIYQVPSHEWGASSKLADLDLVRVQAVGYGPVDIRLDVSNAATDDWRCVLLAASMSDRLSARRYHGVIEIDPRELPSRDGPASLSWKWWLQPEDAEAIDGARTPTSTPLMLNLHVHGAASINGALIPVHGNTQVDLPLHEWNQLKQALGASIPPSQQRLLSPMNLASPAWTKAVASLDGARARLTAGDSYHALQDIFDAFEVIVSQPYSRAAWLPLMEHVPEQKREGIASALSGFLTAVNKVGRHRNREDHEIMPLDAWEAELIVAVAHYLLAYAHRLTAKET